MQTTSYPDINELLADLLAQIRMVLGPKLAGLYLYGSLTTGDFDHEISDIDLLAATATDIGEQDFAGLDAMQEAFVARPQYQPWKGRLEIAYLSTTALKTFRTQSSPLAIISPGEPFHIIQAGAEWLMNWYMVREVGRTLCGPPPTTVIDPIAQEEFVQAVQAHAMAWRDYIHDTKMRKAQSYAILTLSRAYYTVCHGEQVSKQRAAVWTKEQFPQWSTLIEDALWWRKAKDDASVEHAATLPETHRFVHFMINQISSLS